MTIRGHAGRYSLALPAGMAEVGGERSMRGVALREVPLPREPGERFGAAFAARLAEIAALRARRPDPAGIDGELRGRIELAPAPDRFEAVLFHGEDVPSLVIFAALRQREDRGLWLTRPGAAADEARILADIAELGDAYRHIGDGAARPVGDVFHLPAGVIALAGEREEAAEARWLGAMAGIEVTLTTQTTDAPEEDGLMARFGAAVESAGPGYVAALSVARCRPRLAAGLAGEEFVMRDSQDGVLYFLWEFPGEPDSGARPRIQLQLVTVEDGQREKMASWDALVDSLRPVAG